MKKKLFWVPVLTFLIGFGFTAVLKADEMKQGTDYAALATKYEKMAADQDAVIAEHETMKTDMEKQHPGKPGVSENAKMKKHCDSIIKDAKKLKADYEGFAAWCKLMAKENVK